MKIKEQKYWTERHFQICLALIARPIVNVYGNIPPVNFTDIINKADRMVRLLMEREQNQNTTTIDENSEGSR